MTMKEGLDDAGPDFDNGTGHAWSPNLMALDIEEFTGNVGPVNIW